jgi:hypothetical protein
MSLPGRIQIKSRLAQKRYLELVVDSLVVLEYKLEPRPGGVVRLWPWGVIENPQDAVGGIPYPSHFNRAESSFEYLNSFGLESLR